MQKISRFGMACCGLTDKDKLRIGNLFDGRTVPGVIFKESKYPISLQDNFNPIRKNLEELEEYDYKIPTCRIVVTDEELAEHIDGGFFKKGDVLSKDDLADTLAVFKLFRKGVVDNQVVRYKKGGFKDFILKNCERDYDIFACRREYLFDLTKINEEQ